MTLRDEVVRPGGDDAPPVKPAAWQVVRAAAVASAAVFAADALLTETETW